MTRVGIAGFRGYSGSELVALLERHPDVEPVLLEHRSDAADRPRPLGHPAPPRAPLDPAAVKAEGLSVVFLATPAEVSSEVTPALLAAGARVIDLSGAYRLETPENYARWYAEPHHSPALLAEAVYGGATRPDARFNQVLTLTSAGNTNYHGLFLAVNRRFARGFLATASYTWSKAINDTDAAGDSGSSPQDSFDVRRDRGLASSNQQHRFVMQAIWQTQFGGPAKWLVDGWLLAPNFTFTTGFPVNVTTGTDLNRDLVNNDRPLFRGRNDLIGPGFREINLRLSRTFKLTERFGLEIIGEAENLLNSTNAACGIGGCSGAVVSRFGAPDFLRVTSALNSRQIQIGGRIRF